MNKTKKSTLLGWGVGDFGFQLMILVSVYFLAPSSPITQCFPWRLPASL